jgi:hypothetical protein
MKRKKVDGIFQAGSFGIRTSPKGELYRMGSKRRLTARFERIENVKNFDVEK